MSKAKKKRKRKQLRWEGGLQGPGNPLLSATALLLAGSMIAAGAQVSNAYALCYAASVQGQTLAYFQEEGTYHQALIQAQAQAKEILGEQADSHGWDQAVTLSTTLAPKNQVAEVHQVTDALLEAIPQLEHVYTLRVDGMLVGAARSADTIYEALKQVKDVYTTANSLSVQFENQLSLAYEYLPADMETLETGELVSRLIQEAPRLFLYTAQPGDTVEELLERFAMTSERLQELNPDQVLGAIDLSPGEGGGFGLPEDLELSEDQLADLRLLLLNATGTPLEPGTVLTVEQVCPLLVTTTVEEQAITRDATPERLYEDDPTMFRGQQRIVQEGTAGMETVLTRTVRRCGVPLSSTDLSAVRLGESTPLIVAIGTKPLPEGCLFLWPVQGRVSSDYGYRFLFGETNFHQGVDIAAPMGTAIAAGADGQVVFAGEQGSYGNLVILRHDNGFFSYYGHCSKLLVTVGQSVTQGQIIAAVGSTGRSTGPHCHFELRYDNSPIDPLLYLPGENNAPARTQVEEELPEEDPENPEDPDEGDLPPEDEGQQPPEQPLPPEDPSVPPQEPKPEEPPAPEEPGGDGPPPEEPPADPGTGTGTGGGSTTE